MTRRPALPLLVAAALGALACGPEGEASGAAGTLVEGTVLEAATGEPLAGVLITGPGAVRTVSDERGRFSLTLEGSGDLVAEGPAGLSARNPLQQLRGERLEVVLHLR